MRVARGAVVFDLDGTLVDTSGDIVAAVNHVRGGSSLPPLTARAVLDEVGFGAAHLIARTTDAPAGTALAARLDEFRRYYREHQGAHSELYPGVPAMIDALAAEFDLYVLSNKPHEAAVREIELQGLRDAFCDVWGAGSLPALKPDPAGVFAALRSSGVDAGRGAMVGDMAVDVATGAAAGAHTFLATWGFRVATAETKGAFVAVESPLLLAAEIRRAIPERS
jgi:HAD superfamily hydrolase (TIGR01509 family)